MRPVPRLLAVTDGRLTAGRPLDEVLAAAVRGGLRAVLVRDRQLPEDERRRLVAVASSLLRPLGGVVLVSSDTTLGGDGVHLSAADAFPPADAFPSGDRGLVGRSCHGASDVEAAAAEGCAYATLSPIFPSRTKPGYGPALGTAALSGHAIPVLALGGVDETNAAACLAAGAAGVAVMGALMGAEDPEAAAAGLVRALDGAAAPAACGG